MALCFDHPLCYRNNSTTIKKYGYNSKPSINGAKFVTVKYGSGTDKRYYLCESSSATSGNKLATVSGGVKKYVNSGYVDVIFPLQYHDGSSISQGKRNYTLWLSKTVFGNQKVKVSNGGLQSKIRITVTNVSSGTLGSVGYYEIPLGSTEFTPNATELLTNARRPQDLSVGAITFTLKLEYYVGSSTYSKTFNVTNVPESGSATEYTVRLYV